MKSYAEAAEILELRRCRGIDPSTGAYCHLGDHKRGFWAENMIHWADRNVTRPGVRHFLLIASASNSIVSQVTEPWRKRYLTNRWVSWAAKKIGVRIPEGLSDIDKAMVMAATATVPATDVLREEARAWARRRSRA